ncbi:MAG TPA: Lrp/AsnC ligand binding domain-containing protein [Candidatus Baltobacteraceae bacterium]|jgi:DNA-binding Lrp family transcriptional regulator|nr:Lrp/AsnC ligand binding domain-containing protein [Candidatus Baltobacteraceae bacterium]
MASAYILIEAAPKQARTACAKIAKLAGVRSAHLVTGPYDIIALVEGDDPAAIGRLVLAKVHAVAGVGRTITCVVV